MPFVPEYDGEFPSLGWIALEWGSEYLARPDTPDYAPLIFTREQAEFLLRFYELDPITGTRIVRRGVISRPRGWG